MPWRASLGPNRKNPGPAPMTLSVANTAEEASPLRGLLPLWVGVFAYALLFVAGDRLLLDADTQGQVTVGQWILDHRAVPETDVYSFTMRGQPWISTQWLAQVVFAKTFAIAGWSGPVVLAASAIAATFALLARFLNRHLSESTTLVFVAAALALTVPHLLARPHVLALPIMVMWVGELIAAADRRGAPSFRLLPLMALWANLHGGFVFGLVLVAPIALDAVLNAEGRSRKSLCCWDCCTWRGPRGEPPKFWRCSRRLFSPLRSPSSSVARRPQIQPRRRCAACWSQASRPRWCRERLSMRRCIASNRTAAARRSRRWPR